MNIKRVLSFLTVVSFLCVGLCGCGNKQSNDESTMDSNDKVKVESMQSASGDPVLEAGSISLTDSGADFQDYTDIGMGKSCEFQFTIENNSGMELTSAAVCCVILDADGNILGTADAWIYAHIEDGVSAVATGQFDYTEYENSVMVKADYGYYDTNGDNNICRIDFFDKDIESTVINLTDSTGNVKSLTKADIIGVWCEENPDDEFRGYFYFAPDDNVYYKASKEAADISDFGANYKVSYGYEICDYDANIGGQEGTFDSCVSSDVATFSIIQKDNDTYYMEMNFGVSSGIYYKTNKETDITENTSGQNTITNNIDVTSFTNAYGTSTTKCAHNGCSNYIASSGDTNCCTTHSNRCLGCKKYIDEDALYCVSCIEKAANEAKTEKHTCEECGKEGSYTITGITGQTEYYCYTHYKEMQEMYDNLFGDD